MQIAKMFATLGFQVDTSGLVTFKKALSDARSEMTNITRGGKNATRQFRNLRREVDKLSSSMGKIKNAGGNRAVGGSYRNLAGDVWKVNNALNSITTNQPRTTKAIGKINASVIAGLAHWNAYRRSIVQTRRSLANLNGDLARLRANARVDIRIRNQGGGNGGGGGSGGGGGDGGLGGLGAGFGLRGLLGGFLPSAILGGGGMAAGYAAKELVESSRAQTRMESAILMTADSAESFDRTINYVRDTALRLGLSSVELGKSFSQINLSAKNLSQTEKEEMFTGFSEFMMSMGTSSDDQKGILIAINQMFGYGRILQQEINQLSERGIPATLVYNAAMEATGAKSIAEVKKIQEKGALNPDKVMVVMSRMLKEMAHDSGSFDKMMQSSITKQGQFYEKMSQTSQRIMDSGLDVWLGKVFGQLSDIVDKVEAIAKSVEYLVKGINELKKSLDSVSGGNGGKVLAFLALLVFRFNAIRLGAQRALIVFRSGGFITRALGELFKGVLGNALKLLITRFGGLITVVYLAITALVKLGKELQQKELGNWTIFDSMALRLELVLWKVKLLVSELKWLKSYMDAGLIWKEWNYTKQMVKQGAMNSLGQYEDRYNYENQYSNKLFDFGAYDAGKSVSDALINFFGRTDLKSAFEQKPVTPSNLTINFYENGKVVRTEEVPLPAHYAR